MFRYRRSKGMKKIVLTSFLAFTFAFADDIEETIKGAKENINNKEAQEQAEKTIQEFHKNMDSLIEKWKENIEYDENTGKLIIKSDVEDKLKNDTDDIKIGKGNNPFLTNTDRIYIFISSSVPKDILIEYAKQIVDLGLENRAVMIIRGCIGGCTKIKPTLKWLSSILHEDGKNKNGIPVQIWIDPLMFRMYKVKEVPCVAFAENVNKVDVRLSEGLKYNLKNNPQGVISCGDWSLSYHIKNLYEKTKNPKLKRILDKMKEKGFYYANHNKD